MALIGCANKYVYFMTWEYMREKIWYCPSFSSTLLLISRTSLRTFSLIFGSFIRMFLSHYIMSWPCHYHCHEVLFFTPPRSPFLPSSPPRPFFTLLPYSSFFLLSFPFSTSLILTSLLFSPLISIHPYIQYITWHHTSSHTVLQFRIQHKIALIP
jgi:hypothetical protein